MLGTEWSQSFPRLMCACTLLLPHTSGPHSLPLSKSSLPKKPSKHQSARPPQGSIGPGTLPTVLSQSLRKSQGQVLYWGSCKSAGTQCSQDLTHWPGFCICCPLQTPLTQAAPLLLGWLLCYPLIPSPCWLRAQQKSFCGQKRERYKFWVTQ